MTTKNNILLIGATGFLGRHVLKSLLQHDHITVTCFLRPQTRPPETDKPITIVRGDLKNNADLEKALAGKTGVIHLTSFNFGYTENVVACLEKSGIQRALFISTTSIFTTLNSTVHALKKQAEDTIMCSNLRWTILRPTMIYGRKGDGNIEHLVRFLKKMPLLIVPGKTHYLQQPVFVDDVACAVVDAFFSKKAEKKAYNISGKTAVSFRDMAQKIGVLLGKHVYVIPFPLKPCLWLVKLYQKCVSSPKITPEHLLRLNQHKNFSHEDAARDFGFSPIDYGKGITSLVSDIYSTRKTAA